MTCPLDKITLKGFKSIKSLKEFELTNLNVLIGANGAGKSNFISFFKMLRAMMELSLPDLPNASLDAYVKDAGGNDGFLFRGPKVTKQIDVEITFGDNAYRFQLAPTADETFLINNEGRYCSMGETGWWEMGGGYSTPRLLKEKNEQGVTGNRSVASYIFSAIDSWKIYHFHDTSKLAPMRRSGEVDDSEFLRFDAANIAPFLLSLKEDDLDVYQQIVETIKLVTPFFDDFVLKPKKEKVRLQWKQKGSDYPFNPHHLSDGTIRFMCLTTALLQPNSPSTIIIDEPELGLHPYAIEILAELFRAASKRMQVIVATQSPALVDCFAPENVIVVNRKKKGASQFQRLNSNDLSSWLEDYSLGDLWRKNIVTGGPAHESN